MRDILEALSNLLGPEHTLWKLVATLWFLATIAALLRALYPRFLRWWSVRLRRWKVSQLDEIARRLIDSEQQYLGGLLRLIRERKWEPQKFVRPDLTLRERTYEPIDPILILLDRVAPSEASPEMTLYERKEKFQTDKVRDLLSTLRRLGGLTILGDPGSGKTTCLYQLGVELANRSLLSADLHPPIPLFMPLNEFTDNLPEVKKSASSGKSVGAAGFLGIGEV